MTEWGSTPFGQQRFRSIYCLFSVRQSEGDEWGNNNSRDSRVNASEDRGCRAHRLYHEFLNGGRASTTNEGALSDSRMPSTKSQASQEGIFLVSTELLPRIS